MKKLIFILIFLATSCVTQRLTVDNWEECMNCGKHYNLCEEEACAD